MTTDDIKQTVEEIAERVKVLEEHQEELKDVPDALSRLEGAVETVTTMFTTFQATVISRFNNVDKGVSKASSWDTLIKLAVSVLLPMLGILVPAYVALKAGLTPDTPQVEVPK